MKQIWTVSTKDWLNGLVVAVLTAIAPVVLELINQGNFDLFSLDWAFIGKLSLSAGVGYMLKKLLTDENNKLGGVVKL